MRVGTASFVFRWLPANASLAPGLPREGCGRDLFVKNWTPESGARTADIAKDEEWLTMSLLELRAGVAAARGGEVEV